MERVELVSDSDLETRLDEHLRRNILPDPFLYIGDDGARNWITLDGSDDFPVAVRLQNLLEQSLPEIASHVPAAPDVVSLGVGKGEKERLLLLELAKSGSPRYFAVDVSRPMVDVALRTARHLDVDKTGIVAFVEDLPQIRDYWRSPVLLCLLGNNFSNYDPGGLLALVREQLGPNDVFLFDCHLLPPDEPQGRTGRDLIEGIYCSRQNALFNMGPLICRGMDLDDCVFHLELTTVDSSAGPSCRTAKWLDVIRDTRVCCASGDLCFERGSRIELGFTYKHTLQQVTCHLTQHGFEVICSFTSQTDDNLLVLAKPDE